MDEQHYETILHEQGKRKECTYNGPELRDALDFMANALYDYSCHFSTKHREPATVTCVCKSTKGNLKIENTILEARINGF